MAKLLILAPAVALALGSWAGTLDIAVRGRAPEYAIVRAADASPSVKYAAEELRDFTERLTGVRLPIVTDCNGANVMVGVGVVKDEGRG